MSTQKFKTVTTLAFPLHLLPYFPSLYVSPCVTTPTDSLSALLKFISLLCSLLSSPSVGSLYFASLRLSSSSYLFILTQNHWTIPLFLFIEFA